jgi:cobalamin biosynthesis protein CbiG
VAPAGISESSQLVNVVTTAANAAAMMKATRFLVRVLQLSPGEAAARVRAAAAVGPRKSMLGERLEPLLPRLAGLQRAGAVSTEKMQIVAHAMQKLSLRLPPNRGGIDYKESHAREAEEVRC